MADNTQHAIFGKRTGSPGLLPFCCKPFMRPMVLNLGGIDQGNQHIDIKQKSAHGSSSRSWFTNSDVTRRAPFRTLRSGTPLRVLTLDSVGASARLAKQEITSAPGTAVAAQACVPVILPPPIRPIWMVTT